MEHSSAGATEQDLLSQLSPKASERIFNYIKATGWMASAEMRESIGPKGESLPWYTYSATYFLTHRVVATMRVFEYGSGNSTLWWASRALKVTSCEHSKVWYDAMAPKIPSNVNYIQRNLDDGQYAEAILESSDEYEIIVIDGRDRVATCSAALKRLSHDGIIVWDNADRRRYSEAYRHLEQAGFRRLPFRGHGPINGKEWETAVYYRTLNCLGI